MEGNAGEALRNTERSLALEIGLVEASQTRAALEGVNAEN
jgi:hypothetical protein